MAAEDLIRVAFEKQELDDTVSCCICTDVYTDPKALPCIHTFYMKCLQQVGLTANKGPGDEMPCPICRRQFKIPQEGFTGLPNNFFIAKLIQVANVPNPSDSSNIGLCDVCLADNEETGKEIPKANMHCIDCKQKMCEECCKHHRKSKLSKNHKLVPINEQHAKDENGKGNLAPSVCELHDQKVLDIYCIECKTVECAVCFIEGHKHHEGSHVSKYVDDFRKQIESSVETINQFSCQTSMKKAELNKIKENTQKRVERLEEAVMKRRDHVKQLADSQANSLLQRLCSLRQSKLKEIEMEAEDIESHLFCLQSYSFYCQKMMAKGSASDICRAVSNLSVKAGDLKEQCQSLIERKLQSFKYSFKKSEFEKSLENDNLIGEIEDKLQSEFELDATLVQTIRTKAAEEKKKSIQGLTILDNELFVVSEKSSEVEVYDSIKYSFSRQWNLKELIQPQDIVSCDRNKCLYIFDYKSFFSWSNGILRVDPNGILIKKWLTGNKFGYSLSVTNESNVILPVYNKSKLNEYSPDGQLIRELNIQAGPEYCELWHAVKLTSGDFVVSLCSANLFSGPLAPPHGVCIVDGVGKPKKLFNEKYTSTIGHLNVPFHLSVDGNGFVMVVDQENSRVLLLDSDLEFKREILSKEEKHGLRRPTRILLDAPNDRLLVADNDLNNQRILIFDF